MNSPETKPNILLLIKSLGLGGAERLLIDSLPYLDQACFNYHVAYLVPWKAMLAPQIIAAGLPVTCLGESDRASTMQQLSMASGQSVEIAPAQPVRAALALPVAYWRLQALVQQKQVDLIHADMPMAGILARFVGRRQAIPVVYTEHNLLERYHQLTRWVHGATFGWQDCVLTVSEEVHASVRRSGGDHKTDVRTLLNGVPVEQIRNEATGLDELRRELAIPPDHIVVGSVAVFRTQKRLDDWLAVAAQVAQHERNITFLLVGDGPEMPMIRTRIEELSLAERIRLPGFRADGRRYIGLMDIFLMTSQFEGLPIAMLEAMTLGKAVVATTVGGIPEVVMDGQEGLLASAGAIALLAEHVKTLIDHPDQRKIMGEQGARKIEADYHIRHRVRAIEQVYAEVWQQRQQLSFN